MGHKKIFLITIALALLLGVSIVFNLILFTGSEQNTIVAVDSLHQLKSDELAHEKLVQEITRLKLENQNLNSLWNSLSGFATFITAIVAIIGVLITFWKQLNERQLDRRQRDDENKNRINEKFSSILYDLGSGSQAIRAGAAVSLFSFLKPEHENFHEQAYLILYANMRVSHGKSVKKLLIKAFEKALRLIVGKNGAGHLDLTRMRLDSVNLSGLDLKEVDIAFSRFRFADFTGAKLFRSKGIDADLNKARFSRANLREARFKRANFQNAQCHNTNLVSANLKETNMCKAQLQQAKLQGAHFDDALLLGTKFEQADLNDTFFYGASFDRVSLTSILKAKNWQKAHFDDDVKEILEEMSELER